MFDWGQPPFYLIKGEWAGYVFGLGRGMGWVRFGLDWNFGFGFNTKRVRLVVVFNKDQFCNFGKVEGLNM